MHSLKHIYNVIALFVLGFIVILSVNINYTTITNVTSSNYKIYILTLLMIAFVAWIRWGLTKTYVFVIPFSVFYVMFYVLSIVLVNNYSTYIISKTTYIATLASFLSVLITYLMSDYLFKAYDTYGLRKIATDILSYYSNHKDKARLIIAFNMFLSVLFTTMFFLKAGSIPMFAENPEIARVEAMKGAGFIHRFSYFPLYFSAIIFSVKLAHQKIYYGMLEKKDYFLLTGYILAIFYNMMTGPRSYSLWTIIYMWLTYQYLVYYKINVRQGLYLISSILLIVAIVGGIRYSGVAAFNTTDTIVRFVNRIYMNPVNADRIIEVYRSNKIKPNSFLIDASVLLPGYQPDLGTVLKDSVGAEYDGGGITVPLPAEGYMNYGLFGSILYGIIFGLLLKTVEIIINKVKNPFLKIQLMVIMPFQLMGIVTMGLSGILIKSTLPMIVILLLSNIALIYYSAVILKVLRKATPLER